MRSATLAALAAAALGASAANATPISWDVDAIVARTNLPAIGPIAVGDAFSAALTFDSDKVGTPLGFWDAYAYFNVFDSFSLNIGGKTLNLGPQSSDLGFVREANWLGNQTIPGSPQQLQMAAVVYDGADAYQAYLSFEFTDTSTFPLGTLPGSPPSLASATLRDFSIYSPVNGDPRNGAIFVAGGNVESIAAATPVPEPTTLSLLLLAFAPLLMRRRAAPRSAETHAV
jgi:hypothetical protein